ncbi:hypothetical protein [Pedobacter sp. UC225_65]|uniref:hypothetical protein n=1 Tax=Pedobacter sp. UC225_65 TaxID=3350173 RepID=UPI003671A210
MSGRFTANPCLQQDGFLYTKISCLDSSRGFGSELAKPELIIDGKYNMPRKKAKDQDQLLVHPIIIRVDNATQKRLERLLQESNCRSIGEVVRKDPGQTADQLLLPRCELERADGRTGADPKGAQDDRDQHQPADPLLQCGEVPGRKDLPCR